MPVKGLRGLSAGKHWIQIKAALDPMISADKGMMNDTVRLIHSTGRRSRVIAKDILLQRLARIRRVEAAQIITGILARLLGEMVWGSSPYPMPTRTDQSTDCMIKVTWVQISVSNLNWPCPLPTPCSPQNQSLTQARIKTWSSHHRPRRWDILSVIRKIKNSPDKADSGQLISLSWCP